MKRIILLVLISFLSINVVYSYNSNVTAVNPPGCNCNGYLIVTGFSDHWSNSYYWYLYQNGGLLNYSSSYNGSSNVYVASSGVYDVLVILYDAQGTSYPQWHYGLSVSSPPPCQLSSYIVSSNNISNYYCSDGQITVMGNTNTCNNTITYTLYKDGQYYSSGSSVSNQNVQWANLPSGSYSIIADNGYSNTTSTVTLTEPPCDIQANIITSDLVTTGVNCSNGSITWESTSQSCLPLHTVTITKDGNPYNNWNYNFTNGQQSITGLGAGAYDISISNGVCSTSVATQEVEDSTCSIDINYTVTNSSGYNCNNGNVNFTGFTNTCNPSTWVATLYKNGAVYNSYIYGIFWWGWNYWWGYNHNFSSLGPGTYELNLYDGECDKSIYFTITEPPCNLAVTIDAVTQPTGFNCYDGAITYFPTDSFSCTSSATIYLYKDSVQYGSPQYETTNGAGPFAFTSLPHGNFYLKIDNGYCQKYSNTVNLIGDCNISITTLVTDSATAWGCLSGSYEFYPNGNNSCTDYFVTTYKDGTTWSSSSWLPFGQTQYFNNLAPGEYFSVIDNGYCKDTSAIITIHEEDTITFAINNTSNTSGYACNNGSVDFTVTNPNTCDNGIYWYIKNLNTGNWHTYSGWYGGSIQYTLWDLPLGTYEIWAHNYHGQWYQSSSFSISEPAKPTSQTTLDTVSNSTGFGCNNGSFTFTPIQTNACRPDYYVYIQKDGSYYTSWGWISYSSGQQTYGGLPPGNYSVEINNGLYLDTSFTFSITEPICDAVITTSAVFNASNCNGGVINYIINSSSCPNYDIKLYKNNTLFSNTSAGPNSQYSFSNLSAGSYFIVANNGHCSDTSDIVVINNVLTISSSLPNPICNVLIPTFTVTPAIPIASPTYRWRKNGVIMQTSSSPTYTPTSFANGNTITCQLIGTGCNVTSNTLTLQVITCTNANVSVKAFIQGYLNNGMLTTALLNQGESTSSSVSDSITVELCEPIAPYNVVHAYKNELSTNGNINFTLNPNFIGNSYYIVLKHRNSIETWSSNPVLISTLTMYDFTNAASKALGDNQANFNGSFAMFTGDIDQNGYLELDDYNLWDIEYQAGYPHNDYTPDLDGNGYVELDDYNIWDANYQNGVYTVKP